MPRAEAIPKIVRTDASPRPPLRKCIAPLPPPAQRRAMATPSALSARTRARLDASARSAAARAYAPYSQFRVGAAVLGGSGRLYSGANVENASYGLCLCAERTAITHAISEGESSIVAVAVYTPTPTPTLPCGACRQVIREFGPAATIRSTCRGKAVVETSLDALLPAAFGPEDLGRRPTARRLRRS